MSVSNAPKLCCVIGYPVEHSLSPLIHNAGYRALGLEQKYNFQAFPIRPEDLSTGLETLLQLEAVGVSVTLPHKVNCVPFVQTTSAAVDKIGAANTLVRKNFYWQAENTDYLGILHPLLKLTELAGKEVAVLGASGAARAAVYALTEAQAKVTIFNRTADKAESLAEEFSVSSRPWEDLTEVGDYQIIVNATSIGLEASDPSPIKKEYLRKNQIVFDCVYNLPTTALLTAAKEQGATTIHGVEMFIEQAREQFLLYTGEEIDAQIFRETLNQHFNWK